MLRFQGSPRHLCDGLTRRDLLTVGGLGAWSLSPFGQLQAAPTGEQPESADGTPGFGRAKRCLLLFLFGGAPQHETFDPKPLAPAEIQGELKAIPTAVPGMAFCEGLPKTATVADRLTVVRSMTHPYPLHGVAYALSGLPVYTTDLETKPFDAAQWPYVGSMADYHWTREQNGRKDPLQHVGLPWTFNSQVDDLGLIAGPYASFLGSRFNPLWTSYTGSGQQLAPKCRHEQTKEYMDPYARAPRDGRFSIAGAEPLSDSISTDRFDLRKTLLQQFDSQRTRLDAAATVQDYSDQQTQALALLTSTRLRDALDFGQESESLRLAYGDTLFGQSCLTARRLLEAGGRFVTVFWDAYGTYFSGGWDTHQNHYPRLKQYLLPGFDSAFASLIQDLDDRGLLDETLVICTTEHGRTPQIDSGPVGAARHHWSRAYSTVLAGGGIPRGQIVGATDAIGGDVVEAPMSPKDIQATALHLLGIPPHTLVRDRQQRPFPMSGAGEVRSELLT